MEDLPPQIDAEFFEKVILFQSLLGKNSDLYTATVLEYLNPDVIRDDNHRVVAKVIHDTYQRTSRVPTMGEIKIHLADENSRDAFQSTIRSFQGFNKRQGVADLPIPELLRNTEIFLKERLTSLAIDKAIERESDGESLNANEVAMDIERAVNICLTEDMGVDLLNTVGMDWFSDKVRQVSRTHSTGYPWLDRMMQGGFVADEGALYMFGGATNVGKSNLLANFVVNLLRQDLKCLIVSLEMSEFVYAKRILAMLTGVWLDQMPDEVDQVTQFVHEFTEKTKNSQLFIKQFPTSTIHYKNLDAYVQRLRQTKGFEADAYFIDYPGIMLPYQKTGRNDTDIKRAHEEVRALSVMYGRPFISVLQLNKDGFDVESPDLKTTGGSIGISQTSDLQANLYAREDDIESGHLGLSIQKSRFGPVRKSTKFKICENTLRISECDLTGAEDVGDVVGVSDDEYDDFEKEVLAEGGSSF